MKELLRQMAAYNYWANQKLTELILSLSNEQQLVELPSSFNSLHKTLLHMWDAESAWWQRVRLHEKIIVPSENFNGSTKDNINGLLQQDQQWLDWINSSTEAALDHVFQYYNSKKELFKQPVYQIALHVFNHNTYHRGQLVNMLRQLGIEKIPQTDLVIWQRLKK